MTYPKLSFTGTSFSSNHESTINSKPAPIAKQDLKKAKLIQVPMIYIDAFENIKNEGYTFPLLLFISNRSVKRKNHL
ncbi:hypothetical protein [Providencia huaxiensis]|uniref:hypothetical protein n=1 Tax=Providencia huaxiensis TaxID=2027290 RepID=UPI0034DDB379